MVVRRNLCCLLVVVIAEMARAFSIPFGKKDINIQFVVTKEIIDLVPSFLKGAFKLKHVAHPAAQSVTGAVVHPTQLRSQAFQTSHKQRMQHMVASAGRRCEDCTSTSLDKLSSGIDIADDSLKLIYETEGETDESLCIIDSSKPALQLSSRRLSERTTRLTPDEEPATPRSTSLMENISASAALESWADRCHRLPSIAEEFYTAMLPAIHVDMQSLGNETNTALDTQWQWRAPVNVTGCRDVSNEAGLQSTGGQVGMDVPKLITSNGTGNYTSYMPEQPPPLENHILAKPQPAIHTATQHSQVDLSYIALFCFLVGVMSTYLSGKIIARFRTWYASRMPRFIAQLEKRAIALLNTGEYAQVKAILTKEMPGIVQYRGPFHVDTAAFRHFLGKALLALHECSAAEEQLALVVEAYEIFGEDLYMAHALEDLALSQQCLSESANSDHNTHENNLQKNDIALQTMQRALRIFTEDALAAHIITPSSRFTTSPPSSHLRSDLTEHSTLNYSCGDSVVSKRSQCSVRSAGSGTTTASHSSHSILSTSTSLSDLDSIRRSPLAASFVKSGKNHCASGKEGHKSVRTPQKGHHNNERPERDSPSPDSDYISHTSSCSTDTTIGDGLDPMNLSKISEGSEGEGEGELDSPFCDRRCAYAKMSYDELFSPQSASPALPSTANPMLLCRDKKAPSSPLAELGRPCVEPLDSPAVTAVDECKSTVKNEEPPVERDHALRDALEDLERLLMQPTTSTSMLLGNTSCLSPLGCSYGGSPTPNALHSAHKSTTKSAMKDAHTPAKDHVDYTYCSEVNFSCTPAGGNISSLLRPVLECPCNIHVARVQHRVALVLQALMRPEEALDYMYASRDIYIALSELNGAESAVVKTIDQEIAVLLDALSLSGDESLLFSPACGYRTGDKSESWEEVIDFTTATSASPHVAYGNLDASFLTTINNAVV